MLHSCTSKGPDCVKMAAYGLGAQPLGDGQNILEKIDRAPERHQGGPPGFQQQLTPAPCGTVAVRLGGYTSWDDGLCSDR